MFDVLKTLSTLVKTKPTQTVTPKIQKKPEIISVPEEQKTAPVEDKKELKRLEKEESSKLTEIRAQIKLAEAKAREILVEAKDEAFRIRREAEDELRKKFEVMDRKEGAIEEREKHISDLERDAQKKYEDAQRLKQQVSEKLEKISNLTANDARSQILEETKEKLKGEIAKEIKEAEIKAREEAEIKAQEILIDAMRHGANDYVAEYTVSVIKVTDEDVKGRIIGKEGRNIRAFETATGVDVDLDEEGVIRLSCFDPVRRETARVALERLLKDGRVQPGRIEEVVEQVKKELERIMFEEGQKLCHAVGVYNLPSPIVALLGRFKYRFSYGQNMIAHTMEETKIGIAIAREVGADVNIVRLGCLLHDIGKVRSYDSSGNGTKPEVSLDGVFMDHIALGCSMIEEAIDVLEADKGIFGTGQWEPMERRLILHLVLAHHGELEWGSPVRPVVMEAQLLHFADNTDAWANRFERALEYAGEGERGTMKRPDNMDRFIYIPLKRS